MKTIGYIDNGDGNKTVRGFKLNDCNKHLDNLFLQKKNDRIFEAFQDLKGLGNCSIILIDGRKTRIIAKRRI